MLLAASVTVTALLSATDTPFDQSIAKNEGGTEMFFSQSQLKEGNQFVIPCTVAVKRRTGQPSRPRVISVEFLHLEICDRQRGNRNQQHKVENLNSGEHWSRRRPHTT